MKNYIIWSLVAAIFIWMPLFSMKEEIKQATSLYSQLITTHKEIKTIYHLLGNAKLEMEVNEDDMMNRLHDLRKQQKELYTQLIPLKKKIASLYIERYQQPNELIDRIKLREEVKDLIFLEDIEKRALIAKFDDLYYSNSILAIKPEVKNNNSL